MENCKGGSVCEIFIEKEKRKVIKRVKCFNEGIENGYSKLFHEVNYLKQMNNETNLFPKALAYYEKDNYLYSETEYLYEGETFTSLIFNSSIDEYYIGKSLDFIIKTLFNDFYIKRPVELNTRYWTENYIDRTVRRLNKTIELVDNFDFLELKRCIQKGITINGIFYDSAYKYLEYLKNDNSYLEKMKLKYAYRSHHDLIPENIVIKRGEDAIQDFKMIDPRGESETGINNRHYIYDMGKMKFGLDSFGIFRNAYATNKFDNFHFTKNKEQDYKLVYNSNSKTIQKLIYLQERFTKLFYEYAPKNEGEDTELQLLFSYAFMYIPDVPCRMIDEKIEEQCIAFYSRGIMILHELMLKIYGQDQFSTDKDGKQYEHWPLE